MSEFIQFRDAIKARLDYLQDNFVLVRTNVPRQELYSAYLGNFKAEDNPIFRTNTVHDCNTDKSFLKAVGNIVAITPENKVLTLWEGLIVPTMYQASVDALHDVVISGAIQEPMCWHTAKLGEKQNISVSPNSLGETFDHFYAQLKAQYVTEDFGPVKDKVISARQTFMRCMSEVSFVSLETVLDLINDRLLVRGEQLRSQLERIIIFKGEYEDMPETQRIAYSWRMAVTNPNSLPRFSSAIMVAVLAVEEGKKLTDVVNMFNKSVAGESYQRVTSVATKAQIKKAQETIKDLGLENSLQKRHARTTDMSINDVLFAAPRVQFKDNDVFADLLEEAVSRETKKMAGGQCAIEDFIQNVLPEVESMEVFLEGKHKSNMCNILSQVSADAPSIHPWGNGSTWSYTGDQADAVMERVKEAGGVHDAKNCLTLHWNYTDDLDIYLKTPHGMVYYGDRSTPACELDVDMNVHGETSNAVENIFFKGRVPDGKYVLSVKNHRRRSSGQGFGIRLSNDGEVSTYNYAPVVRNQDKIQCLEFTGRGGKMQDIKILDRDFVCTGGVKEEVWGLTTQTYVPVETVMLSPNFWNGVRHGHKHYMFMLQGCKNPESVRSFYNEQLKPELKSVRKVLEMVGGRMRVEYSDDQMAGIGISESKQDTLNIKLKMKSGQIKALDLKF